MPSGSGLVPCADRAELADACEAAGLLVLGPDGDAIRALGTPAGLAAVAAAAGVPLRPAGSFPEGPRRMEVDTLRDAHGTVLTLGLREVTVVRGSWAVLAELPATGVPPEVATALEAAAQALVEEAGYRGEAVVHFALDEDGAFAVTEVDTDGRATHAGAEERTGAGILGARLLADLGGTLPTSAPHAEGWTLEARLLAHDPDRGYAPTGGRVEAISLPVGTGVRVDGGLRAGDVVDPELDPVVATVTSWGRTREQALQRLRRALERTSVVLSGGATNRTGLIGVLTNPTVVDGPPGPTWYAEQLASGALVPAPDPVAVVVAAIEVYERDLALVQRSFRASAERGRPEHPEHVGTAIELGYRGSRHRLRVDRTGPDRYRVHDGVRFEVLVDTLSQFERRVLVGGRTRRVVAVTTDEVIRLEIDGVAHTVTREDGVVLRAPMPALVSSLLVEVGERVTCRAAGRRPGVDEDGEHPHRAARRPGHRPRGPAEPAGRAGRSAAADPGRAVLAPAARPARRGPGPRRRPGRARRRRRRAAPRRVRRPHGLPARLRPRPGGGPRPAAGLPGPGGGQRPRGPRAARP